MSRRTRSAPGREEDRRHPGPGPGSTLVDRLAGLGADVVELPVIAVADPVDGGAALRGRRLRLAEGRYDWVVLTSANAVDRLFVAAAGRAPAPGTRWAVVGTGTAAALRHRSGRPTSSHRSRCPSPWSRPSPRGTASGRTVLFPRAEQVRGVVADGLRAKGYAVDEVAAYRTVAGEPGAGPSPRWRPPTPWPSPRRRPSSGSSSSWGPAPCPRWWVHRPGHQRRRPPGRHGGDGRGRGAHLDGLVAALVACW